MREIKFRGKRIDNDEWIYGDLIHDGFDGTSGVIEIGIAPLGCYPIAVIIESVGQFTGLHDKNGKEIYEGDIVLIREGIAVITFYCGSFWCDFWTMLLLSDRCVEVEVIGNIHENPELIK